MKIKNLTCELQNNPVGIDNLNPRFAWQLISDENGQKQTAYQIQVANSEDSFNSPIFWDTGKIDSENSVQINYSGSPLESGKRYFWRVKVWDKNGNPTEFCNAAFFEMGLLKNEDWKGKWISLPHRDKDHKPCPIFRKEISVGENVKSVRAYVSGLGYYELYFNNEKVGDHTLDPGATRYDKNALYVTYEDLKIKSGKNVVGVMLGNGWLNVYSDKTWNWDEAPWRGQPRFILQIKVDYENGKEETFVSDETWKGADGPVVYNNIRDGETYDARKEKTGWLLPDCDDNDWENAVEAPAPEKLSAQTLPPIKERKTHKPVSVNEVSDGKFIYDFGQNFAGRARIKVSCEKNTEIRIVYSELLKDDGDIDQSNIDNFSEREFWQVDNFISAGKTEESFESRFIYHGFRYAQITSTKNIKLLSVEGAVINTDLKSSGKFECSNELFNSIQKATLESYNSNFHSYPTDCPQREKNGWTGDAHLAAEAGLFNFNSELAYEKWMQDFADAQGEAGEIAAIIPTSGWGYEKFNGPAWDSAYPLIVWYLYLYKGNVEIIKKHYDNFKKYIDLLNSRTNGRGLITWGLGDWVPPYGNEPDYTAPSAMTSTSYYYYDAVLMSKMAKILNKKDDEKMFTTLAEKIKKNFNSLYHDKETDLYAGASQTAQSCAVYQGLADNIGGALKKLVELIKLQGNRLNVGILGYKWTMNSLSENGEHEIAYKIANRKDFPSWGYWLENGATTLLEDWRGTGSHNHIMFGDISAWFYKFLAGINPDSETPGFKKFIIKPMPTDDLNFVKAEHDSPYGKIKVHWTKENKNFNLSLEVPANTTAVVHLPEANSDNITVNGEAQKESVFTVESGKYNINCH